MTELNHPNTVAIDNSGDIFITDCANNRIRKINAAGTITTVAGNGISAFFGDGGPATAAELNGPVSIALDLIGNLYISTSGDMRIRKVNSSGIITTIAGDGTAGYNGDGIAAIDAKLFYPYVGTTDNAGNIYISDYGNHRVRKINSFGIITTIAGDGINGSAGDGSMATAAQLGGPGWIYRTTAGDIYIPDNIFNRIRKIDAAGIITTFAGGGAGGSGDGGPATSARLIKPTSIAFDDAGNAFIADGGASVIRKVNSLGIITTIAGDGTAGYNGDGIAATSAEITPNAVACDASGNLYIADYGNNRIRRVTYNSTIINNVNEDNQKISIYPSPARDKINIGIAKKIKKDAIINIISRNSELLLSLEYIPTRDGNNIPLDISSLKSGIYFVKINEVFVGQFIKE